MHSTLESPSEGEGCSSRLVSILQSVQDVPSRFFLSPKACQGILRRATRRGKVLPERLQQALEAVAMVDIQAAEENI
jgi:hypothetical protein